MSTKKEQPVAPNKCPSECKEKCKEKCKTRARRFRKCGKCCVLTGCAVLFATVFVLAIAFGVAAYKIKHCVYPAQMDTKTYTFDPATLNSLEFHIPTGSIKVYTCSKAKNVTVTVTTGAKTTQLLQEIVVDVMQSANSLSICAKGPGFDLQNCQIMHVTVVIPESSKHPISLSATAEVGYIRLSAEDYTFDKVDLNVTVGVIRASQITASKISAAASLGGIMGCTWNATCVDVHADIGGACLSQVTSQRTKISVDKGVVRARCIDSAEFNATLHYGCMVQKHINAKKMNSNLKYGRMWVSPSPKFSGSVTFSTCGAAHFDVSAGRGLDTPAVITQTVNGVQQKTVRVPDQQGNNGNGQFNLKSASGNVFLFITNHD